MTHQVPLPHLRLCVQTTQGRGPPFQKHLHSTCPPLSGPCPDAQVHEASVFGGAGTQNCQVPNTSLTFSPFPAPWSLDVPERNCVASAPKSSTLPAHSAPTLLSPAQPGCLRGYTKHLSPLCGVTTEPSPSLMLHGWHGPLRLKEGCVFFEVLKAPKTPWCHVAPWCQHLFPTPVLGKGLGYLAILLRPQCLPESFREKNISGFYSWLFSFAADGAEPLCYPSDLLSFLQYSLLLWPKSRASTFTLSSIKRDCVHASSSF